MKVQAFQRKCFNEYKKTIRYPEDYTFLYGNPVNPVVPIETARNKVMIIGASPTAKSYTVNDVRDVPLFDINAPFSKESYFDGSAIKTLNAGEELDEIILEKLGINREDCWITNLVKIFLFEKEHVDIYAKLGKKDISENKSKFNDYARISLKWLREEIEIANPYVIILLGREVISNLFLIAEDEAIKYMTGEVIRKEIIWKSTNFICLPNPRLIMIRDTRNPWPLKYETNIGPRAKKEISRLKSH